MKPFFVYSENIIKVELMLLARIIKAPLSGRISYVVLMLVRFVNSLAALII